MRHEDYTVGWICALPEELATATWMLDREHESLPQRASDSNVYALGEIGAHNVAIACLPSGVIGTTSAARVAEQMRTTFPAIRIGLLVGIGGGAPSEVHDIRLGDVVVSQTSGGLGGVIQYDFGKTREFGRFEQTGFLNRPPDLLLSALTRLKAIHISDSSSIPRILAQCSTGNARREILCTYPGEAFDKLFQHDYHHASQDFKCKDCDPAKLVYREVRDDLEPFIHYGLIASGNQVMRDGVTREKLREQKDVLCFEMEASGLMDNFPCLVIRGICDYSDTHKTKRWQAYAAAVAAAYAKELLGYIPAERVSGAPPAFTTAPYHSQGDGLGMTIPTSHEVSGNADASVGQSLLDLEDPPLQLTAAQESRTWPIAKPPPRTAPSPPVDSVYQSPDIVRSSPAVTEQPNSPVEPRQRSQTRSSPTPDQIAPLIIEPTPLGSSAVRVQGHGPSDSTHSLSSLSLQDSRAERLAADRPSSSRPYSSSNSSQRLMRRFSGYFLGAFPSHSTVKELRKAAEAWAEVRPFSTKSVLSDEELSKIMAGTYTLERPPELRATISYPRHGVCRIATPDDKIAATITTSLPMYAASYHNPTLSRLGTPHTIYFEVRIRKLSKKSAIRNAVSLGFVVNPYPPLSLPGWNRGSVGIHSDSGGYCNDSEAGPKITKTFKPGDVIGVGLQLSEGGKTIDGRGKNKTEMFLTRDGKKTWQRELMEDDYDLDKFRMEYSGLDGKTDLYGAIGVVGAVEVEWLGSEQDWQYTPSWSL